MTVPPVTSCTCDSGPARVRTPDAPAALAIVGIGLRMPGGATDPCSFWQLMVDGVDAICDVPADRWDWRKFYDADPAAPGKMYVRQGGFLQSPIDTFDARYFGMSPREAATLDPQQRLLLEVTADALADAGQDPNALRGSQTGVFVGGFCLDAKVERLGVLSRDAISSHTATSATMVMLSNRLSYAYDLRGPSMTVDTACSSSLVAFHLACRSVWSGESERALAGGVNVMLRPEYPIAMCKGGFLSPDARCMAFDERANGYVRGEGAGVVVVRPLADAMSDGDRIYAIVRATGVNQDGRSQGITVPNPDAQRALVQEVLTRSGVPRQRVRYVEAHGTGTQAGDPVEAASLGEVLGGGRSRGDDRVLIGSVKTQIGHLEAAAGIAGLIKAALALYHRMVPGNLHFRTANPRIDLDALGLRVPVEPELLSNEGEVAACVNSFGYGGTNAHAVLETPPAMAPPNAAPRRHNMAVMPLSAADPEALRELAGAVADRVEGAEPATVDALASTAARRRGHLSERAVAWGVDGDELAAALRAVAAGGAVRGAALGTAQEDVRALAFVYSGMGAQWWGMGRELMRREPVFREAIARCDDVFAELAGWRLSELFEQGMAAQPEGGRAGDPMRAPCFAQPANLALQVGLTELWASLGVRPAAVVGHSVGEIAAAWAAGALPLDEAFRLTHHRCRLQQVVAGRGGMLAVGLSSDAVTPYLDGDDAVVLAAVNGPSAVTLSGSGARLERIAAELDRQKVFHRPVLVDVAYHSPQMVPLESEFRESLAALDVRAPEVPLYSSVTGQRLDGIVQDLGYWWRNVRDAVDFHGAVRHMLEDGIDGFVEIGPHPVLGSSIRDAAAGQRVWLGASQRRGFDDVDAFFAAFGALYAAGGPVDWEVAAPRAPFQPLPRYPFRRERLWFQTPAAAADRHVMGPHPLLQTSVPSPGVVWESELSAALVPWLPDHVVQGEIVLPAAAYAVSALALARSEGRGQVVQALRFERPLVLRGPVRLRTELGPDGRTVTFAARPAGDEQWTTHARARLSSDRAAAAPALDVGALRARLCAEEVQGTAVYDSLAVRGLAYGRSFRPLRSLRVGEREALGELRLRAEDPAGAGELHPTLLDGALQALIGCVDGAGDGTAFVPVEIRELHVHELPGERCLVHARLQRLTSRSLVGCLTLCDDDGRVLVSVEGVRCQAVGTAGAAADDEARLLYRERWDVEEAAPRCAAGVPWTVVAGGGAGGDLVAALRAEGADVAAARTCAAAPPGTGLALVLDSGADDAYDDAPVRRLLAELRTIVDGGAAGPERIAIVTRGAHEVSGSSVDPAAAAAWGLARVAGTEHPELALRRIDLPRAAASAADLAAAAAAVLADDGEDERAVRDGRRYVPRVVAAPEPAAEPTGEPCVLGVHRAGTMDGMRFVRAARRPPGPGEIELEVRSASINFKDLMKVMNLLPPSYLEETYYGDHLGLENAGVVVAVGPGVEGIELGDPVVSRGREGSFRRFSTVPTRYVVPKPRPLSFDESCAFIAYTTPYYGLVHLGGLAEGERVLIHSATGGVGLAALEIARWRGAEVLATAGTEERREYLRSVGVQHVFDSRSLDFVDGVRAATDGAGVDVVLNSLTGDALLAGLSLLRPFGRFVEIGKRDIIDDTALPMGGLDRNISLVSVDIDLMMLERPALFSRMVDEVWELMNDGMLAPLPVRAFPASLAEDAFRTFARARHIGRLVLRMDDPGIPVTPVADPRPWVRPGAWYVVTGGLGGVGLELAGWLADQGATRLSLWSRSGVTTEVQREAIGALRARGVEVEAPRVDVSDACAVREAIASVAASGGPAGVFHAAMVLDDVPLHGLDEERLRRVLDAKARGAWHLHEATRELELDVFVLLSSISAVIGNAGQGSYVAANAYLDALAHRRRSEGLPALSVNLGAVADVGVARPQP